jgi:predicted RND superfamily exporter protein
MRAGNGASLVPRPPSMERYVSFVVRHRVAVVVAVLLVTALFGSQLGRIHLEIRRRANLPSQHRYVRIQNRISDLFGGEAIVIIGVVATDGHLFEPRTLAKVYRITEAVRSIPAAIESSVVSIAAPSVKAVSAGAGDDVNIHRLMSKPLLTPKEAIELRDTIRSDELLRQTLISADESSAIIVAEFDDTIADGDLVRRIDDIVGRERDSSVRIALAGAPVLRAALGRYTAMIAILFPLAVLVIGLIHYEAFRSLQAMLLPLVTALLSVLWALGIMGALRLPMDTWSAMTPVLILAIAAGHAVQILKRYYEEYARVGDSRRAVIRSVTAVGPVMLTAGFIAAAGFGSLMTFQIASVRVFGLLLSSGILSAVLIEMTFTPACRSLLPVPKRYELSREGEKVWLDRLLDGLAHLVVVRPQHVLAVAALVVAAAAAGTVRLDVDNSFRLWFAPSTRVRQDDAVLNEKLSGTATLRVLIEGDRPGVLRQPRVLRAISDLDDFLAADPEIGGVVSIADHVKRLNRAMNHGDPAAYRIPDDEDAVAEYLLLYGMAAGPDGLASLIDADYRNTVIRALSKTDSAAFSRDLLKRTQNFADHRFAGLPVEVDVAGGTLGVQTAMNDVVVQEKMTNMLQVGSIIVLLCALIFRSAVGGLFVLIPLVLAVVVDFGAMGWTGTWLDMTTAAISAMGISIGADFAIYLIFRVREEYAACESLPDALRAGLVTSGKAIFFVSSAVAVGYAVLAFSGFSIWARLGVLTAIMVSVSALATLTVLPALALLVKPRFLTARRG